MEHVSASSVTLEQPMPEREGVRLSISVQASSLGQAVELASALPAIAAEEGRAHSPWLRPVGRRDWIVALTTPPLALTPAVIQRWEGQMRAVEQRWPGCRFLGWRTWRSTQASSEPTEASAARRDRDALEPHSRSQRELVLASLLRRPTGRRQGIVHGRGVPR
jgi:hypothetical protein